MITTKSFGINALQPNSNILLMKSANKVIKLKKCISDSKTKESEMKKNVVL